LRTDDTHAYYLYIYIYIYIGRCDIHVVRSIGGHDAQKRQTDKAAFVHSNPKRTHTAKPFIVRIHRTTPPHVQSIRVMYHNILWRVCRVSWTTHVRYTGKIKKARTRCPGEIHAYCTYTPHNIIRNIADTVVYYVHFYCVTI